MQRLLLASAGRLAGWLAQSFVCNGAAVRGESLALRSRYRRPTTRGDTCCEHRQRWRLATSGSDSRVAGNSAAAAPRWQPDYAARSITQPTDWQTVKEMFRFGQPPLNCWRRGYRNRNRRRRRRRRFVGRPRAELRWFVRLRRS